MNAFAGHGIVFGDFSFSHTQNHAGTTKSQESVHFIASAEDKQPLLTGKQYIPAFAAILNRRAADCMYMRSRGEGEGGEGGQEPLRFAVMFTRKTDGCLRWLGERESKAKARKAG